MKLFGKEISPKKLFKAKQPDLENYIGRFVTIPGEPEQVKIESITGNIGMSLRGEAPRPTFYEINGKYLIGMLRFHAQMLGDKSITEQQFLDFENIEFEAERLPDDTTKKTVLNNTPKYGETHGTE